MRTFIGIDPGVNPVLCVILGKKVKFTRIKSHRQAQLRSVWPTWRIDRQRLDTLLISLVLVFNKIPGNKVVGLESVAYAMKYRVAMMGKIEYVLQGIWNHHKHMEWMYMIAPGTWKKIAVGKGNASKDFVREELERRYPRLREVGGISQDHYDAFGIALATKKIWEEKGDETEEKQHAKREKD